MRTAQVAFVCARFAGRSVARLTAGEAVPVRSLRAISTRVKRSAALARLR